MNHIIKSESVDFNNLIKSNTALTINCQSKMIEILNKEFTEEENRWYIANLYIYMNYHPTKDFPINLDTLVKLVEFANKQNAKRTLVNNFTEGEDYKILLIPKDEVKTILIPKDGNKNTVETRGRKEEKVMLNIDTFKNMCMLVKTEKSKQIRKYYVKLENIYNKIIKEEIEEKDKLLEEKDCLLKDNSKLLVESQKQNIQDRQNILLNSYHKKCIVYLIKINENLYKFGNTDNIKRRFSEHLREISKDIQLIYCIESKNNVLLETNLKQYLNQVNFKTENIINGKNQTELIKTDSILDIQNKLIELNTNIQEDIEILKCKEHILELKLQILKYKSKNTHNNQSESENEIDNEENDCNIDSIDNMSLEELKAKLILLEARKAKQLETHKKYMAKYRQSDKYKHRVSSDEYKQNRNKKYKEKGVTEQQKQKRKDYYNKTKNNKSDLIKTEVEKNKFHEWLKIHITQENNSKIVWWELLNKYLNYKTSDVISKIYKEFFMDYVSQFFPNITTKYKDFGYKHFTLQF